MLVIMCNHTPMAYSLPPNLNEMGWLGKLYRKIKNIALMGFKWAKNINGEI
nr:MAG TPA: hypothetical protein [Caudoviricetes sp.]